MLYHIMPYSYDILVIPYSISIGINMIVVITLNCTLWSLPTIPVKSLECLKIKYNYNSI